MKIRNLIVQISAAFLGVLHVQAQDFQNLNFEEANPTPDTPGLVAEASALPDWTVEYAGVPQTVVGYNFFSTGAPMASVENSTFQFAPAIDGNYSVFLQASGPPVDVSIIQTAVIPTGMQTLLFEARPGFGQLEVSIGGQAVPFSLGGGGANYALYGANISAWAGDKEALAFSALGNNSAPSNWLLDDISFSPNWLPEPSPLALTVVGGMILAAA